MTQTGETMKKKQVTWMFQYEVDDTIQNCTTADGLYIQIQSKIEEAFPNSNQIVAYIHKESEKP